MEKEVNQIGSCCSGEAKADKDTRIKVLENDRKWERRKNKRAEDNIQELHDTKRVLVKIISELSDELRDMQYNKQFAEYTREDNWVISQKIYDKCMKAIYDEKSTKAVKNFAQEINELLGSCR